MKQRYDRLAISIILCQINKWHDNLYIPDVEEVVRVTSYPPLESMGFDTDISDGVSKISAAITLVGIVCLHQCTKIR